MCVCMRACTCVFYMSDKRLSPSEVVNEGEWGGESDPSGEQGSLFFGFVLIVALRDEQGSESVDVGGRGG